MLVAHQFCAPLAQPLKIGLCEIRDREGILLEWRDVHGSTFGEVSPLPGLHHETLEDCLDQLRRARSEWSKLGTVSWDDISDFFEVFPGSFRTLPSLRFGIEQVVWQRSQTQGSIPKNKVKTSGLAIFRHSDLACRQQASGISSAPHIPWKVKVGSNPLGEANLIRKILLDAPELKLRLDANRSLTVQGFDIFSKILRPLANQIDYFEDPLMEGLPKNSPFPLALDETLYEFPKEIPPEVSVLVVKPAHLGGIKAAEKLWRLARETECRMILSSVFDSSLSQKIYGQMACHLRIDHEYHGINTASFLKKDLGTQPLKTGGGIDPWLPWAPDQSLFTHSEELT